jgi:hypothetical protein
MLTVAHNFLLILIYYWRTMVRILGNSPERVQVPDLGDSIFYKQTKEYTDQQYETSRDLKRAIDLGRLTILENVPSTKGSAGGGNGNGNGSVNIHQNGISKGDLKDAIREVMSEKGKSDGISARDLAGAVREIAPLIIDTVRQEISSKLSSMVPTGTVTTPKSTFVDPAYTPAVTTEGMTSNIKAEEKQVSGSETNDALAALQNMNLNNK